MAKVLITPRSFAKYDQSPYKKLEEAGIEVIANPGGGILSKEEMIHHLKNVDGVILGVDPMDKEVITSATALSVISKYGVGTDNIDVDAAKEADVKVTITANANSEAVADYAYTLMLSVARRVVEIHDGCKNRDWTKKIAIDMHGKKLGVLGLGAIGQGVIRRAKGFAMDIYGYDINYNEEFLNEHNVKKATITEIFKTCDFISIHMPLTPATKHVINKDTLKLAKTNLVLVNTARGGIIEENDLYEALKAKQIFGAGIDVFEEEPAYNSPLLELENVIVGSHCGASTVGAVNKMSEIATDNLIEALKQRGKIK